MTDAPKVEVEVTPPPASPPEAPTVVVVESGTGGDAVEAEYIRQIADLNTQLTERDATIADLRQNIEEIYRQRDEQAAMAREVEEQAEREALAEIARAEAESHDEQKPATEDEKPKNTDKVSRFWWGE